MIAVLTYVAGIVLFGAIAYSRMNEDEFALALIIAVSWPIIVAVSPTILIFWIIYGIGNKLRK